MLRTLASSWLALQPLSPKLARARGPGQEGPRSVPLSPCCSCTAAGGLLEQVISDLLLALAMPFPKCLLPGPTLTLSPTSPAGWTSTDCGLSWSRGGGWSLPTGVWKRVSGHLLWAYTGPHVEGRWAGMAALGPTTPGPLLPSAGEVSADSVHSGSGIQLPQSSGDIPA